MPFYQIIQFDKTHNVLFFGSCSNFDSADKLQGIYRFYIINFDEKET